MKEKIEKILTKDELKIIKRLNTPQKIQVFLEDTPFNFEKNGETYYSPRQSLKNKKMHCFEGAIFATLCLSYHGFWNRLIDLKVKDIKKDDDHIICIFKQNKYFGAISKTNHSVLRYRDPIYKTTRELVMTYFHEYFLDSGEKTLDSYSKPFNIFTKNKFGWIVENNDLDQIAEQIDKYPHQKIVPNTNEKNIRKATKTEIRGAKAKEYDE